MSSNKKIRQELEKRYGKECFIKKLGLRKFDKPIKYTSKSQKKKMEQLSYHHILEKSKGGQATVENGALLSIDNHTWFHKQSSKRQQQMNDIFQDYKNLVDECKVFLVDDIDVPFEVKATEIKINEKGKFNRAKQKEEDRKIIREEMER